MLTEHFIASVGAQTKPSGTTVGKDASIIIQEYQPLNRQRAVLKKSATPRNCLAVSDSHVFAAQSEKAVVHVYNRQKGNQEATVPFTKRITCITLACNETVLVLGTAEGRIFLWETASGRQVTTAQSHLQAVTVLAVDPNSNFLLSASADSTIHVWSIPSLLSFSSSTVELPSPLRTFTSHRSKVEALVVGHSSSFSNIAVSASTDKTCLVWDYFTNTVLRTYLLPAGPTCLALDAADRGVYLGYDDGSIQLLDFFSQDDHDAVRLNFRTGSNHTSAPIQPSQSSRWKYSDATVKQTLSLSVSFDGSIVLSGHESGIILRWDVGRAGSPTALLQNPLPGPVTNLLFLPVTGFNNGGQQKVKIPEVVKPKFGAFDSSNGGIPGNYALSVEFSAHIPDPTDTEFERSLTMASFPTSITDAGLIELRTWGKLDNNNDGAREGDEDFMALDDGQTKPRNLSLEEQNASLRSELEALRRLQRASFEKIEQINTEKKALIQREQRQSSKRHSRIASTGVNGDNGIYQDAGELSSSSDER